MFLHHALISFAVVVSACGGATQRAPLPTALLPVELSPAVPEVDSHVLRVRVYAGVAYRARVLGWEAELARALSHASGILQRASGIRLDLVETIAWKRSGGSLVKTLEALSALDPGLDVDLVVGLIEAAPDAETELSKLVGTRVLGRHIIVRSFNRLAESAAIGAAADGLDEASKDELLDRRGRHKQSVILASGIARLLGAGPGGEDEVNALQYRIDQRELGGRAAEILRITTLAHLESKNPESAWKDAIAKLTARNAEAELLDAARLRMTGGLATPKPGDAPLAPLRESDRETLETAGRLLAGGKDDAAWEQIESLLELYPEEPAILDLCCLAAQRRGASNALARCQLAVDNHASNPATWLALGKLQIDSEPARARESLKRVEDLFSVDDAQWSALARAYRQLSLPTRAAQAASHSGSAKPVAEWAEEVRARYGTSVGVSEEQQGEYLRALESSLKLVYARNYAAAARAANSLRSAFPKAVGTHLVECEIALRRRQYSSAQKACKAILALQEKNSWARYLLGVIHAREGRNEQAIASLREAIEADDRLKAAYVALASIYRNSKDPRLSALAEAYLERFKQELK